VFVRLGDQWYFVGLELLLKSANVRELLQRRGVGVPVDAMDVTGAALSRSASTSSCFESM
jgi:hypothetical protein